MRLALTCACIALTLASSPAIAQGPFGGGGPPAAGNGAPAIDKQAIIAKIPDEAKRQVYQKVTGNSNASSASIDRWFNNLDQSQFQKYADQAKQQAMASDQGQNAQQQAEDEANKQVDQQVDRQINRGRNKAGSSGFAPPR